ncbi:hypothetical protein BDV97DRAFT_171527 [Delphinella strobiligena]|nr:hypothetical protein BDV97DRAFT_171527 [Delphinella strobiligena]
MLDVGGQDATEAFEDVGHSDEAREILEGMLIGTLKRQVSAQPSSRLHCYASFHSAVSALTSFPPYSPATQHPHLRQSPPRAHQAHLDPVSALPSTLSSPSVVSSLTWHTTTCSRNPRPSKDACHLYPTKRVSEAHSLPSRKFKDYDKSQKT